MLSMFFSGKMCRLSPDENIVVAPVNETAQMLLFIISKVLMFLKSSFEFEIDFFWFEALVITTLYKLLSSSSAKSSPESENSNFFTAFSRKILSSNN